MQSENYRANLKEALKTLVKVNQSIYGAVIDISMQGELKDFNDAVPIGETHQFDFDMFRNCDDINVQLLVKIIEHVDASFESIKNLNAIEFEFDEAEEDF